MKESFSEIINKEKPTLVDFYADWCGPCKTMKPILEHLKQKVGDAVSIIKIDVDKNPQVAGVYGIQAVPTLVLFKNGQIKWRQAGIVPANNIEQIINQNK